MKPSKLKSTEFDPYFSVYINLVSAVNEVKALKRSKSHVLKLLKNLPKEKHEYRYAEGKWTIKELVLHLTDVERIFLNRALRFSRKDQTSLPGFDHDSYVDYSHANDRKLKDLLKEYKAQRNATILFFKGLNAEMLKEIGTASSKSVSVRAMAYIIAGHDLHHSAIIKERYL